MDIHKHDGDILRLALPSIVSNVTVPLLGLADVTIMGHIGDARYIGAIAVGSMIFNVVYWLFGFLRMGTSGLTAQAYGASERLHGTDGQTTAADSPGAVLRQALTVALVAGGLIVLCQWPLRLLAFWLMGATADVELLAIPYYNICVWGAPAVLGLYALTGWFVGMQDTRTPMIIAIGQNVLNILLSATFVFVLGMGVEGAALGTLLSQWAGFAGAAWSMKRKYGKDGRIGKHEKNGKNGKHGSYGRFLRVNRDIFLRTLCLVSVNLYFTAAGARQGALLLAVNTLLMQLFMLFSYFIDGFAYAGEALAGRYLGAADLDSLRAVVRRLFGWGMAMMLLFTALYALGGEAFLRLLTNDTAVISAARPYYGWALLIPVSGMAAFVWDGIFIGLTRTRGMLWSCFAATVVFFACWLLFHTAMGNHALWLSLTLYLLMRGLAQTLLYCRFYAPRQFGLN